MKIPFVKRSRFLDIIEEQVVTDRAAGFGWPFEISLGQGGYPGRATVLIMPGRHDHFDTDWELTDPTRFPVRIRAAATWLRDHGHFGRFIVTHDDGLLTIEPLESQEL